MATYILNIDWLAVYGYQSMPLQSHSPSSGVYRSPGFERADMPTPTAPRIDATMADKTARVTQRRYDFEITLEVQSYGTRQFSMLSEIYIARELFGYLQTLPRTGRFARNAFILKVANSWLYRPDWQVWFGRVCGQLGLNPLQVSRLDLAADFNKFENDLHPIEFIRQFMSGEIKHKGRSQGHVDYRQRYAYNAHAHTLVDSLNFNALVMGKRESDAHCYLYNKSLELQEQKMKPYIVDCWTRAGFDVRDVWRLEVSMKRKALSFVDRNTGDVVEFGLRQILDPTPDMNIAVLYHVMLRSLFFFFRPSGQKNVSREKMINLFGEECEIARCVLHSWNPSNRSERILIKQLHTLMLRYRGITLTEGLDAQAMAEHLVHTMGLERWYANNLPKWTSDKFKA